MQACALRLSGTVAALAAGTAGADAQAPAGTARGASCRSGRASTGDPARGKAISYTCLGCHGIERLQERLSQLQRAEARGTEPRLPRRRAARIPRRRPLAPHHARAGLELSDQDIADIAAYFAGKPLKATGKPAGHRAQGGGAVHLVPRRRTAWRSRRCIPRLPGSTRTTWCGRSMSTRSGGRKNPIMKGFAANLKDEDIESIAQLLQQSHALARHRAASLHPAHRRLDVLKPSHDGLKAAPCRGVTSARPWALRPRNGSVSAAHWPP